MNRNPYDETMEHLENAIFNLKTENSDLRSQIEAFAKAGAVKDEALLKIQAISCGEEQVSHDDTEAMEIIHGITVQAFRGGKA